MDKNNFWNTSKRPLVMLAPMEDVTDTAFRELVLHNTIPGHLDVVFTEFASTDGLCHPKGRENVAQRLVISKTEQQLLIEKGVKIVAQIWGNNPEKFFKATKYIDENYRFDGIDINMGCPVRNVVAQGSCSALIENEPLAKEIIQATREATSLPVSVKTRIGLKKVDTERWINFLFKQPLEGLILHGRIQKQMSEGEANWEEIAKAVAIRNKVAPDIPLIGNGDVFSVEDMHERITKYGTDGAMIGRGIFKNPWMFQSPLAEINTEKRLATLFSHLQLYESAWGRSRPFPVLKRFFKIYVSDFRGASEIRKELMETNSITEARRVIENTLSKIVS
ncbi:tRNA-dihydrouridine synthase [Saccharicrinis carchari]|uniref:tRNA-dihydrouridine synthase n=1 Tax=Saccharicrinis carchari TaxID=1168039 RepID=A0A521ERH9_SACCC|nr:tRNA-dihydrouridine synthase family protein [Saccharicrinis carchari]SMO86031.1 tRNA-dihydrouridine synthase [Saccharicrinis carchari]